MAVTQMVFDCKNQKVRAIIPTATINSAAVTNRIVTTTNMANASYTVAAQPYGPSKITVTTTASGTADTQGIITVTGTDIFDRIITDVITPVAGSTVSGTKYFKTVTTVVGSKWVVDAGAGNDTIVVGVPADIAIQAPGLSVSFQILTGTTTYFNPITTATASATTSIPLIAGDSWQNITVDDTLSFINSGGGTLWAIIWEPIPRPC